MQSIKDSEFGEVTIRRSALAQYVRLKVGHDGTLTASLPKRAPLRFVTQLIDQSRDELRSILKQHQQSRSQREHGSAVGKSHTLHIKHATNSAPKSSIANQQITIYLPLSMSPSSIEAQKYINEVVKRALKKEATAYLPRRVYYLAEKHGFSVDSVRFNNAKTRWGSRSNNGSINLNVALMQLPFELIDYVIIHELCHIKQMNHGPAFWQLVESLCPEYKALRKELHKHNPYI